MPARFTVRERTVLDLMADGLETIATSDRLGIAPHPVGLHVRQHIEKLAVHSKRQVVISAARLGLIDRQKR